MQTRDRILRCIEKRGRTTGKELAAHLGMTRQAIHAHLKPLQEEGAIRKIGSTRGASYVPADAPSPPLSFSRTYLANGLEEDRVYDEVALHCRLSGEVGESVRRLLHYAFTEMLNNAIDHSKSRDCAVRFRLDPFWAEFEIRDKGIGLFHSIADKFNLPGEDAAVGELVKGKTTTMADRHSGEGIFFTSKVADRLSLRSHRIDLTFETSPEDVLLGKERFLTGTRVAFRLKRRSRKRLEKIFDTYSPEEFDFRFEKTSVHVRLFGSECVSRSQAKRLVANLERFREVNLDFKGVRRIGQGFADEVFRVFAQRHPHVSIHTTHVDSALEPMIRHVLDK